MRRYRRIGDFRLGLRQRAGQAGQRIRAGREAGFGEDPVDHGLESGNRQQLRGEAIAKPETVAIAAIGGAIAAAKQASRVEDPDIGNFFDRLDRLGERARDDVDARQISIPSSFREGPDAVANELQ